MREAGGVCCENRVVGEDKLIAMADVCALGQTMGVRM
jgi:hypothetical protein